MPAITPLPASPGRTDSGFKAWVESLLESDLSTAIDEINTAIAAFNTDDLQGTSATSFTPNSGGLGSQVFVTQSGKSWLPGQWVTGGYTSDGREYWAGPVQSYSGTSLTVDVQVVSGHGTARTAWSIAFSPPVTDLIGDHQVIVHSGNGYGSTNTKRRRYSTLYENTGSDITYADDAALGATFTINAPGLYVIQRQEKYNSGAGRCGVALNASSGTTIYTLLTFAEKLGMFDVSAQSTLGSVTIMRQLSAGDVITMHDNSIPADGTSNDCFVMIRRVK